MSCKLLIKYLGSANIRHISTELHPITPCCTNPYSRLQAKQGSCGSTKPPPCGGSTERCKPPSCSKEPKCPREICGKCGGTKPDAKYPPCDSVKSNNEPCDCGTKR